jgi:hypothetical protein
MAQLTKAQLATENAADFPNNNSGLITPAILRGFNTDMIDSLVDEVSYNIDSASFSASIAQLDNFSSSLDATFATDAQLTALSTSIAVTDLAQSASIAALQQFSSSLDGGFVSETEFGVYTSSNDSKWNTLGGQTGSYVTEAESGSFVTSVLAGVTPNIVSVTKGNGTINTVTIDNVTSASFAFTASEARNVVIIARNGNDSSLGAGTVVHITGATGDNPIFNTASFTTELLSANTLGILRTTAASGADVEVLVNGIVTGVNTDPALGYVAGDIIYLSSSGQFTRVQPQAPNQVVTLGQVLRAQQNNGSIYVSINNGWELNELHNVAINGVADGDLLVYRSASGLWTNSSSIELGNATTGSNTFGGTQTMNNLIVNGTASFAYTQTVTGSAVIIGEEYIILNNQTPTQPYAGIKVFDSGSAGVTASLLWDGINDHWVYEQVSGAAYGAAGFLSGPTGSSLGTITYPSANRLVKGGGSDHLYDSNISDNGSVVSSAVSVEVTGSVSVNGVGVATTGSNNFFGNQRITGSVRVDGDLIIDDNGGTTQFLINEKFTTEFLGSNLRWQEANKKVTWEVFESEVQMALAAYSSSGYDNGFIVDVKSDGTTLSDYNTSFVNQPWLRVPVNGNTNPPVQFPRGLGVTGSVTVSGSTVSLQNEGGNALAIYSGSVQVTSPQGTGFFYSNLPITSSNLRINGNGIVADLYVSGVFAGNSTLNVAGNSYFTGSVNINNNVGITGSLDVNGQNIISILNTLISATSSYVTEAETSSFATTGSNNFVGDQKVTGSLRVDGDFFLDDDGGTTAFLMNQRFNTEFLGSQWRWFESAKKFAWDVFEEIVDINLAAYGTGYDNGLSINLRSNGTTFSDYNTSYVTQSWLRIPVNNNNNPAPQFPRGATISGSLIVSSSLAITGSNPTIQSGSLSGSLISNLGDIYTGSNNAQYIVTLGSASMATLLSGSTTNANTLYFVI